MKEMGAASSRLEASRRFSPGKIMKGGERARRKAMAAADFQRLIRPS
jgi:hypothetical protein